MKVLYAVVAWLCIAFVLGLGIYLFAAKGNPWLFIVSVAGFVVAVGKIGCSTH